MRGHESIENGINADPKLIINQNTLEGNPFHLIPFEDHNETVENECLIIGESIIPKIAVESLLVGTMEKLALTADDDHKRHQLHCVRSDELAQNDIPIRS